MIQIKVFIDTNIFPIEDLPRFVNGKEIKYIFSSVTEREVSGTDLTEKLLDGEKTLEVAVWDESSWDNAIWGSENNFLEKILCIISSSSFPPMEKRNYLKDGERKQLRDAMIFENAIRSECDVFVSNDSRAFIGKDDKRSLLENMFRIKVLSRSEYLDFIESLWAKDQKEI